VDRSGDIGAQERLFKAIEDAEDALIVKELYVLYILDRYDGNRSRTAKRLNVSRRYVQRAITDPSPSSPKRVPVPGEEPPPCSRWTMPPNVTCEECGHSRSFVWNRAADRCSRRAEHWVERERGAIPELATGSDG